MTAGQHRHLAELHLHWATDTQDNAALSAWHQWQSIAHSIVALVIDAGISPEVVPGLTGQVAPI